MVSCIIYDIVNSFKPIYCNEQKGLILELSRQALVGGGEVFKVLSQAFGQIICLVPCETITTTLPEEGKKTIILTPWHLLYLLVHMHLATITSLLSE